MYIAPFRTIALLAVLFAAFMTEPLQAAENYSRLVNVSGKQRMLSQQIAKAYFYLGQGISQKNSQIQLNLSITRFESSHDELKKVEDSEVQDLLSFVEIIFAEYKGLVTKSYTKENGALVLELSERLLETCHALVLRIENMSGKPLDNIINISGRQRMLAQRVSKFYIAYQAGFQDDTTVNNLNTAMSEFETALGELHKEKRNSKEINMLLDKMSRSWEQVKPYFLQVRKGGLPLMILNNTDEITQLADQVTDLYEQITGTKQD